MPLGRNFIEGLLGQLALLVGWVSSLGRLVIRLIVGWIGGLMAGLQQHLSA